MADNDLLKQAPRSLFLSPEQQRNKHREEVKRKILERPEKTAEEARKRGGLRFFLRYFHEQEPEFLTELRDLLSVPVTVPFSWFLVKTVRSLIDRYHLPQTIDVAMECIRTLLMWQAFPDLPTDWHFEMPQGALANRLSTPKSARPFPVVFVAEGEPRHRNNRRSQEEAYPSIQGRTGYDYLLGHSRD